MDDFVGEQILLALDGEALSASEKQRQRQRAFIEQKIDSHGGDEWRIRKRH